MYIQKVHIENIRSIYQFEMEFKKPAGWHVLIGDNGSGKSTIIQAISLALIGPEDIYAVRPNLNEYLRKGANLGSISLSISMDKDYDSTRNHFPKGKIKNIISIKRNGKIELKSNTDQKKLNPKNFNWSNNAGWFSAAYGPYRRLSGGNPEWTRVYFSFPKAASHLSAFSEDNALTEVMDWFKELDYKRLQADANKSIKRTISEYELDPNHVYNWLKYFINSGDFLPHNVKFKEFQDSKPIFIDGYGCEVNLQQLSDGFRSILGLALDLIMQLIWTFPGNEGILKLDDQNIAYSDVPGIVLIDEIDAHLHPSWQTRVGSWFTKCFPNMQFIVTTHSPLICRACENGSIWRLASPCSGIMSSEIIGNEKDKLIFGNILDAFGTEMFGKSPVRSNTSEKMTEKLGRLNILSALGKITKEEETERIKLLQIFQTK
jgi:hypothetical protein